MGYLAIQDQTGHTSVLWDTKEAETVATARETFDTKRSEGYLAYRTDVVPNIALLKFDETAEQVVMTPAWAGG